MITSYVRTGATYHYKQASIIFHETLVSIRKNYVMYFGKGGRVHIYSFYGYIAFYEYLKVYFILKSMLWKYLITVTHRVGSTYPHKPFCLWQNATL